MSRLTGHPGRTFSRGGNRGRNVWRGSGRGNWVPRDVRMPGIHQQGERRFTGEGRNEEHKGPEISVDNVMPNQQIESERVESSVNTRNQLTGEASRIEKTEENREMRNVQNPGVCLRCGKVGHVPKFCPSPVVCFRCKEEGHIERVCTSKMPWDYVASFCGLSSYGQGFHVMESMKSEMEVKGMASMSVVTVVVGEATGKQIEEEFRAKAGSDSSWRWFAKKIGDKKYQMRFPNVHSLNDAAYFTEIRMRSLPDVVIKVEKWSSSSGAKSGLDSTWFRITNIPMDKRSVATISMVVSMVGLPLEVDKESMHKQEFVRAKIGCRDVAKVPSTVEGLLDLNIYDFGFQREVLQEGHTNPAGNVWIRNDRDQHKEDMHSLKKQKMEQENQEGQFSIGGSSNVGSAGKGKQHEGFIGGHGDPNNTGSAEKGKQLERSQKKSERKLPVIEEEESSYDSFVMGYLAGPEDDYLQFGSFEMTDLRRVVVNEYGKFKRDPLLTIEAKSAIWKTSMEGITNGENYSGKEIKGASDLDGFLNSLRAVSLSPGALEGPGEEKSSQEELSQRGNKTMEEGKMCEDKGQERQNDQPIIMVEDKLQMIMEQSVEEQWEKQEEMQTVDTQPQQGSQEETMNNSDWPPWQEVRQSKRIRAGGEFLQYIEEKATNKLEQKDVSTGLYKEEMEDQLKKGAEVLKQTALHFHKEAERGMANHMQIIPFGGHQ